MNLPRPEHPKPQFYRENWLNLNGKWAFEVDNNLCGAQKGMQKPDAKYNSEIIVPFCPESKLSGIENKDFMYSVWYKRTVTLTKENLNGRVILHFGAVDYRCTVYVNGKEAGSHAGGYVSFSFDITDFVVVGDNVITVNANDDPNDPMIPSGKQCEKYFSYGCYYVRTTGIWQTVWLEFVPKNYVVSAKYDTDISTNTFFGEFNLFGKGDLNVEVTYNSNVVGTVALQNCSGLVKIAIPLSEQHLWEVGNGRLYDLKITFGDDTVTSYFGMREIHFDGFKFMINGKSVFQRLVLDQGFYPEGIYTAPSDCELENDIKRSMDCGFNGARLHEKIFEERFLYYCDLYGYIVWGEFPNWGLDHTNPASIHPALAEWCEEIKRDYNHPSIIGWCPFNETWDLYGGRHGQCDDVLRTIYNVTKSIDKTRPCIDTSGNFHVKTDIFDLHDYEQDPKVFKEKYENLYTEGTFTDVNKNRQKYGGEPVFISEYGGLGWSLDDKGWSYGNAPKSEEEFIERFRGLADAILDNKALCGLCYTQLTDVEQEQNGLYTYDRRPKFDVNIFKDILSRTADIEK